MRRFGRVLREDDEPAPRPPYYTSSVAAAPPLYSEEPDLKDTSQIYTKQQTINGCLSNVLRNTVEVQFVVGGLNSGRLDLT
jgi:hypothetical protein